MKVKNQHFRSIWLDPTSPIVNVIDQRRLPFEFLIRQLGTVEDVAWAISDMVVRGAPLIGVSAAYGLFLAASKDPTDNNLNNAANLLLGARPTAVNLRWAVEKLLYSLASANPSERPQIARLEAEKLGEEDILTNSNIGDNGVVILNQIHENKKREEPVNILTHCNAGWLATVDWGTALAPIYKAYDEGLPIHVWVDETRPRNQGSSLTAWELQAHGIPHTIIADNAGGHLMQKGAIDVCIVGSDRTARNGDVCNKIGTYLKALAAMDNKVPFYAAVPSSTIDWQCQNGQTSITIEERPSDELLYVTGLSSAGEISKVRVAPIGSSAANPAFDITPNKLVTGIITDRGICQANEQSLLNIYPECRIIN